MLTPLTDVEMGMWARPWCPRSAPVSIPVGPMPTLLPLTAAKWLRVLLEMLGPSSTGRNGGSPSVLCTAGKSNQAPHQVDML